MNERSSDDVTDRRNRQPRWWMGQWNKSKLTDAEAAEGLAFAHNRTNRWQLQSAKLNDSTWLPLYTAALRCVFEPKFEYFSNEWMELLIKFDWAGWAASSGETADWWEAGGQLKCGSVSICFGNEERIHIDQITRPLTRSGRHGNWKKKE